MTMIAMTMTSLTSFAHSFPALLALAQNFQSPPFADYMRILP